MRLWWQTGLELHLAGWLWQSLRSYLWWLLGGRCHLCGDEGLDDVVSGWQELAVAVGGVRALVQHQAAGGHSRARGEAWAWLKVLDGCVLVL